MKEEKILSKEAVKLGMVSMVISSCFVYAGLMPQVYAENTSFHDIVKLSSGRGYTGDVAIAASGSNVYVVMEEGREAASDGTFVDRDIFFRKSADSGARFESAVNLSNNKGFSTMAQIVASENNVYVLWSDNSTGNWDIFFRKSADSGARFDDVINLSNDSLVSSLQSAVTAIAVSGSNVYVVWLGGNPDAVSAYSLVNTEIFFRKSADSGATFEPAVKLSDGRNSKLQSSVPEIAVSDSNVYVMWRDEGNSENADIFFRRSADSGATFEPVVNLSNNIGFSGSGFPQVTASANNVYVVWSDDTSTGGLGGNYEIFFRRSADSGATFEPVLNLSNTADLNSVGETIVLSGSNVFVSWGESNGKQSFRASTDNGASFHDIVDLGRIGLRPNGMTSVGRNVFVVGSIGEVLFRESNDNGSTFGKVINLGTGYTSYSSPIAVSGNSVYVVWGEGDVFFRAGTAQIIPEIMPPPASILAQDMAARIIKLDKSQYSMSDDALIIVADNDVNVDVDLRDTVKVYLYSDSDTKGIMILLHESNGNTGIFEGDLKFRSGSSADGTINAKNGDTIKAVYYYWEPTGELCNSFATAKIGSQSAVNADSDQTVEPVCLVLPLGYPEPFNLQVLSYDVDPLNKSLFGIVTNVEENATLILNIDRKLIDAKNNDKDTNFVVLLDNNTPAMFSELNKNDTRRTLKIQIPMGTERFDIIGTQIVPEFPVNLMVMTAVGLMGVIIVLRLRSQKLTTQ